MKRAKINIALRAILITIAFVGIQLSTLVASTIGEEIIPTSATTFLCPECPLLFPKVPLEAPFWELTEFDTTMDLTPEVPLEATFDDDSANETALNSNDLTPALPLQADFDDLF